MATRTRKVNGGLNGGLPIDPQVVRTRAEQVTGAAGGIARIADEVFEGTELQLRSLDEAVSGINEMAASLKETASQADSVASSSEELFSSINELAASIEQISNSTEASPRRLPKPLRLSETSASSIGEQHGAGNGDGVAGNGDLDHRDDERTKAISRDTDSYAPRSTTAAAMRCPDPSTAWPQRERLAWRPTRPRRRSTRWRPRSGSER